MKEKEVFENRYSNFYIIDCEDFIFFVREVEIIGLEVSASLPVRFTISSLDWLGRNKNVSSEMLFLDFEEAQAIADKLNNKKENKKIATEWNSYENKKRILEMRGDLSERKHSR